MTRWPGASLFPAGLTLETARLVLRLPEERDLDAFAAMYADADTMRFLGDGKVLTRAETWRALAGNLGHWLFRGYGMWVLERKDTQETIGRAGFINPEGWPGFELGWVVAAPQRSQGYAAEAARVALDYAVNALRKERVISLIRPGNAPSIRVAEKLGMRPDGSVELFGASAIVYANRAA